jgi:TetR/AcrR family transcriptional regulator
MTIRTARNRKKGKDPDSSEKDKKKEQLIQTATGLFARKGFADTPIRAIAKAAKVNTALLYYYFKDKEELLNQIIMGATGRLVAILKGIQQTEPDPLECLKKMIGRQISFASESWKETKVLVMDADRLHGRSKTECLRLQREIYDVYMNQLIRLKEANVIGDINLTVANFAIFSMINWFYRWYKQGGALNEEEISSQMIKILLHGFLNSDFPGTSRI